MGVAKNTRLTALSAEWQAQAEAAYQPQGEKVRRFGEFSYKAHPWDRERRIIVKAEHNAHGPNVRYVVTNLASGAQDLYEVKYCARGEMENHIKAQQLDLFSDRTSCHAWWANQFRVLLSAGAYVLVEALRRLALAGTELAQAQVGTIRRETAQGRHGRGAQHPPGAALVFFRLPVAGGVPSVPGVLLRLTRRGAGPGTR